MLDLTKGQEAPLKEEQKSEGKRKTLKDVIILINYINFIIEVMFQTYSKI